MTRLASANLQLLMPEDHPLVSMYRDVLTLVHPGQPGVIVNYLSCISRVLRYVSDWLTRNGRTPTHWVDLVVTPDPVIEYMKL